MLEVTWAHWGSLAPGPELALWMFPAAACACCSRGLRVRGPDAGVVAEVGRVVLDAGAGGRGAPRPLWAGNHLTCWGKRGMQKYSVGKREIDAGEEMVDRRKEKKELHFAESSISSIAIGAFQGLATNFGAPDEYNI